MTSFVSTGSSISMSLSISSRNMASLSLTSSEIPTTLIACPPVEVLSILRTSHSASLITTLAPGDKQVILIAMGFLFLGLNCMIREFTKHINRPYQ